MEKQEIIFEDKYRKCSLRRIQVPETIEKNHTGKIINEIIQKDFRTKGMTLNRLSRFTQGTSQHYFRILDTKRRSYMLPMPHKGSRIRTESNILISILSEQRQGSKALEILRER